MALVIAASNLIISPLCWEVELAFQSPEATESI